jgi:N-acetylmuramic acid 6-phosphate etherase
MKHLLLFFSLLSFIFIDCSALSVTEYTNPQSHDLDKMNALAIVQLMNDQDHMVAAAITPCLGIISKAIETIAERIRNGGRLIYLGAGTSGRLGVLDASECIPTFSAPADQIVGVIAGGEAALRTAIEAIEDKGYLLDYLNDLSYMEHVSFISCFKSE